MKRLWPILLVVFMLCISFSTVTHATDTNLDTPVLSMADTPVMHTNDIVVHTASHVKYRWHNVKVYPTDIHTFYALRDITTLNGKSMKNLKDKTKLKT